MGFPNAKVNDLNMTSRGQLYQVAINKGVLKKKKAQKNNNATYAVARYCNLKSRSY